MTFFQEDLIFFQDDLIFFQEDLIFFQEDLIFFQEDFLLSGFTLGKIFFQEDFHPRRSFNAFLTSFVRQACGIDA